MLAPAAKGQCPVGTTASAGDEGERQVASRGGQVGRYNWVSPRASRMASCPGSSSGPQSDRHLRPGARAAEGKAPRETRPAGPVSTLQRGRTHAEGDRPLTEGEGGTVGTGHSSSLLGARRPRALLLSAPPTPSCGPSWTRRWTPAIVTAPPPARHRDFSQKGPPAMDVTLVTLLVVASCLCATPSVTAKAAAQRPALGAIRDRDDGPGPARQPLRGRSPGGRQADVTVTFTGQREGEGQAVHHPRLLGRRPDLEGAASRRRPRGNGPISAPPPTPACTAVKGTLPLPRVERSEELAANPPVTGSSASPTNGPRARPATSSTRTARRSSGSATPGGPGRERGIPCARSQAGDRRPRRAGLHRGPDDVRREQRRAPCGPGLQHAGPRGHPRGRALHRLREQQGHHALDHALVECATTCREIGAEKMRRWSRYVVHRLAAYNVIWNVGGEYNMYDYGGHGPAVLEGPGRADASRRTRYHHAVGVHNTPPGWGAGDMGDSAPVVHRRGAAQRALAGLQRQPDRATASGATS